MEPLDQANAVAALAWLDERVSKGFAWLPDSHPRDGFTGYDVPGWEAAVWVVHAMYETETLPGGISYDDVERIEKAAGARPPSMFGETNLDELLAGSTLTGGSIGRSSRPSLEWERLRLMSLIERLGGAAAARTDVPPSHLWSPYRSWPINIVPPSEGSLDREQFLVLLGHLASVSSEGDRTHCLSYYSPLTTNSHDMHTVYRCQLGDLAHLYDEDQDGSPSNFWPEDKTWLVYTDQDLWASKVSGSRELIEQLNTDAELEAIELGF